VSQRSGNPILAGYSVLIFFMFNAFWKLVLDLALAFFPSTENPNRHAPMVRFCQRSFGGPVTALVFMLDYCWKAFANVRTKTGRRDRRRTSGWGCLLLFAAMCGWVGAIVVGTLVPAQMIIGRCARERFSSVHCVHAGAVDWR
jgi:hypothetical protein